MIYEIYGKPDRIDISLLDNVLSFACEYLTLDTDLILEFKVLKNFQYGFCDYDEDEVIITLSKKLSVDDLIRTLFHELVHVKQYTEGRLQHGKLWCGIKVDADYDNLPWEIEAFKMEQIMVDSYLESV